MEIRVKYIHLAERLKQKFQSFNTRRTIGIFLVAILIVPIVMGLLMATPALIPLV